MDESLIPVLSALAGSAIGALASSVSTWITQLSQARAARRLRDRTRCEELYGEFITEASRLFVDAFEHELEDPAKLVHLYAIVSTIRLFGNPATLLEAEKVMTQIGETYFAPNKDVRLFAEIAPAGDLAPLSPSARPAARSSRSHGHRAQAAGRPAVFSVAPTGHFDRLQAKAGWRIFPPPASPCQGPLP